MQCTPDTGFYLPICHQSTLFRTFEVPNLTLFRVFKAPISTLFRVFKAPISTLFRISVKRGSSGSRPHAPLLLIFPS